MAMRCGKPAATIGMPEKATNMRTLKELALVLKTLPRLDDDDKFAADVEDIISCRCDRCPHICANMGVSGAKKSDSRHP
jgi:hypothetical protein